MLLASSSLPTEVRSSLTFEIWLLVKLVGIEPNVFVFTSELSDGKNESEGAGKLAIFVNDSVDFTISGSSCVRSCDLEIC